MNATVSISMTMTKHVHELSQVEYEDMVRRLSDYESLKLHLQNQIPGSEIENICVVIKVGE